MLSIQPVAQKVNGCIGDPCCTEVTVLVEMKHLPSLTTKTLFIANILYVQAVLVMALFCNNESILKESMAI